MHQRIGRIHHGWQRNKARHRRVDDHHGDDAAVVLAQPTPGSIVSVTAYDPGISKSTVSGTQSVLVMPLPKSQKQLPGPV